MIKNKSIIGWVLNTGCPYTGVKVEKILKGSLDSIPSPLLSVKIQIMGGKDCLRFKGKTLAKFTSNNLNFH